MKGVPSGLLRYGSAVVSVALVMLFKYITDRLFGGGPPLILFLGAVAVMARYSGTGPAAVTIALSAAVCVYFYFPPYGSLAIHNLNDGFRLGVFLLESATLCILMGSFRAAKDQAEVSMRHAQRQEEALRESEKHFRLLVEGVKDYAIFMLDPGGHVVNWNAGAERIKGYRAEEIIGQHFSRFYPEADVLDGKPGRELETAIAEGRTKDEGWRVRKDGSRFQAHVVVTAVRDQDGRLLGFTKVTRDITESKRAEESLRMSKVRFQMMARATNDAIWDRDLVTDGLWMNEGAQALFGYPADEVGTDSAWLSDRVHPEDRARIETSVRAFLDSDGSSWSGEYRFRHADGSYMHMFDRGYALRDEAGKPVRMIGSMMDISRRKRAEEEIERARELAEAATRAKSEFLANMSHEIRTPMNGVIGMTELILGTPLNDLQRDYAETIRSSGVALLAIINDILDFSKAEAGKMDLQVVELDLGVLMEDVADMVAPRAHQKGLGITCRIDPDMPPRLMGDPVRVRQVLTNLAGNAVKFTDRGEVNLEAVCSGRSEDETTVRILVRDTGMGIPADRQAHVFESFTQVDSGNSRKHGGTGLGLGICRSLVELMGGRIGLESDPGQGSTFWFELTFGRGTGEESRPDHRLDGLRVLVVDDHEASRIVIWDMLKSWGCRAEAIGSGAEALGQIFAAPAADPFQVILIDRDMPGLDGCQTARAIKEGTHFGAPPLVLLNSPGAARGNGEPEPGLFVATLAKPIRRSQLSNVLCDAATAPRSAPPRPPIAAADGPERPLQLRVFLAEDNPVNRRVAIGLAERLGCRVDAVENGREAVNRLDPDRHDLILMDIQMPEMDGLAATAAIREGERGTGRHIPIIALTAHAMEGYREKCLAAGMDDYMTKPLKIGQLREMLLAWGIDGGRTSAAEAMGEPDAA